MFTLCLLTSDVSVTSVKKKKLKIKEGEISTSKKEKIMRTN